VSDKRTRVDTGARGIDNKSCQGAKVTATWPRAIVRAAASLPLASSREKAV
jgi:hypothetical protein